jgi:hypothetical protein
LREEFLKAGGDPADWDVVRLELSEQRRCSLDEFNEVVILENGRPGSLSPLRFFSEVYRKEHPKLFRKTTPAAQPGNHKTLRRAAFEQMPADKRMAWVKSGGVVTD